MIQLRRLEPSYLVGERLSRARDGASIQQPRVEQHLDDYLQSPLRVDVHHVVPAERPYVDQDRHPPR